MELQHSVERTEHWLLPPFHPDRDCIILISVSSFLILIECFGSVKVIYIFMYVGTLFLRQQ